MSRMMQFFFAFALLFACITITLVICRLQPTATKNAEDTHHFYLREEEDREKERQLDVQREEQKDHQGDAHERQKPQGGNPNEYHEPKGGDADKRQKASALPLEAEGQQQDATHGKRNPEENPPRTLNSINSGIFPHNRTFPSSIDAYPENTIIVHVVSHTHWDREWYLSFQQFRRKLVVVLDDLLDLHEYKYLGCDAPQTSDTEKDTEKDSRCFQEKFTHRQFPLSHTHLMGQFYLDGQITILDDYKEIREERWHTLRDGILSGWFSAGPWYTAPDTLLVSGEGLVHNFLYARRRARELGIPLENMETKAYLADSFGHNSQLPQIYRQLGLDAAVLGRGLPRLFKKSELYWQGTDGTTLMTSHLNHWYCFGGGFPNNARDAIDWMSKKIMRALSTAAVNNHIILMNGCDHTAFDPFVLPAIAALQQYYEKFTHLDGRKVQVVHSSLEHYTNMMTQSMQKLDQMKKNGTLPPRQLVPPQMSGELVDNVETLMNIWSSRTNQKVAQWRCERLLEHWAAPLQSLMWALGVIREPEVELYWKAWKENILSQAHDSVGACSVEEVHREVDYRLDICIQLGSQLASEALLKLADRITAGIPGTGRNKKLFLVFNALPREVNQELVNGNICVEDARIAKPKLFVRKYNLTRDQRLNDRDPTLPSFPPEQEGADEWEEAFVAYEMRRWTYKLPDYGFRKPYVCRGLWFLFHADIPPLGWALYEWKIEGSGYSEQFQGSVVDAAAFESPLPQSVLSEILIELSAADLDNVHRKLEQRYLEQNFLASKTTPMDKRSSLLQRIAEENGEALGTTLTKQAAGWGGGGKKLLQMQQDADLHLRGQGVLDMSKHFNQQQHRKTALDQFEDTLIMGATQQHQSARTTVEHDVSIGRGVEQQQNIVEVHDPVPTGKGLNWLPNHYDQQQLDQLKAERWNAIGNRDHGQTNVMNLEGGFLADFMAKQRDLQLQMEATVQREDHHNAERLRGIKKFVLSNQYQKLSEIDLNFVVETMNRERERDREKMEREAEKYAEEEKLRDDKLKAEAAKRRIDFPITMSNNYISFKLDEESGGAMVGLRNGRTRLHTFTEINTLQLCKDPDGDLYRYKPRMPRCLNPEEIRLHQGNSLRAKNGTIPEESEDGEFGTFVPSKGDPNNYPIPIIQHCAVTATFYQSNVTVTMLYALPRNSSVIYTKVLVKNPTREPIRLLSHNLVNIPGGRLTSDAQVTSQMVFDNTDRTERIKKTATHPSKGFVDVYSPSKNVGLAMIGRGINEWHYDVNVSVTAFTIVRHTTNLWDWGAFQAKTGVEEEVFVEYAFLPHHGKLSPDQIQQLNVFHTPHQSFPLYYYSETVPATSMPTGITDSGSILSYLWERTFPIVYRLPPRPPRLSLPYNPASDHFLKNTRPVPHTLSLLYLHPSTLQYSTIKWLEQSNGKQECSSPTKSEKITLCVVLRVFNPSAEMVASSLCTALHVLSARLVLLSEEPMAGQSSWLNVTNRGHKVELGQISKKKIVTVQLAVWREAWASNGWEVCKN